MFLSNSSLPYLDISHGFSQVDTSENFIHVHPPHPSHPNFFIATPDFNNLLFLSQLPFFSPSAAADNLSILRELPFAATLSFIPSGYNWSIRPFIDQTLDEEDSEPRSPLSTVSSGIEDLPPLEEAIETDLCIAFSHLSLRQTGLLHLEPPYNAAIHSQAPPRYVHLTDTQPTPTYFGRTTDSVALQEAIDRAIGEYEEAVHRIGEVLSVHIALLRRTERELSQAQP